MKFNGHPISLFILLIPLVPSQLVFNLSGGGSILHIKVIIVFLVI
jgi:hypothetical protein